MVDVASLTFCRAISFVFMVWRHCCFVAIIFCPLHLVMCAQSLRNNLWTPVGNGDCLKTQNKIDTPIYYKQQHLRLICEVHAILHHHGSVLAWVSLYLGCIYGPCLLFQFASTWLVCPRVASLPCLAAVVTPAHLSCHARTTSFPAREPHPRAVEKTQSS